MHIYGMLTVGLAALINVGWLAGRLTAYVRSRGAPAAPALAPAAGGGVSHKNELRLARAGRLARSRRPWPGHKNAAGGQQLMCPRSCCSPAASRCRAGGLAASREPEPDWHDYWPAGLSRRARDGRRPPGESWPQPSLN